eukprot:jgi/Tetstr1/453974/TSEL_040893.t1
MTRRPSEPAGEKTGGGRRDPFGREEMTDDRMATALDVCVSGDVSTCVAEAVRYIYYTGAARRRNVRIKNNYASAEYWDGREWWTRSLAEVVGVMTRMAIGELEHCVDWSERLTEEHIAAFGAYMERYPKDESLRADVRRQVIEVMISPYPEQ